MSVIDNNVKHNNDVNPQFVQMKEKFGSLRVYFGKSDKQWGACRMAEAMSSITCQNTGMPGTMRNIRGWYVTLSDSEYEKELADRNKTD